jgi:hypothetical protein
MDHPAYKITDLQSMIQIPWERIDFFLADLKAYLGSIHGMQEIASRLSPDVDLGIQAREMVWYDDGVNQLRGVDIEVGGQREYFPNPKFKGETP